MRPFATEGIEFFVTPDTRAGFRVDLWQHAADGEGWILGQPGTIKSKFDLGAQLHWLQTGPHYAVDIH